LGRLFTIVPFVFPLFAMATVDVENTGADAFTLTCSIFARYSLYGDSASVPDEEFTIRRAGLTAGFSMRNGIGGELQIETRPAEVYLKDCFIRWEPVDWAGVRIGQFKKPFCSSTLTSAWNLLSVDRPPVHGISSDLLYGGRDIGLELTVSPPGDYWPELTLGTFNGAFLNEEREHSENQFVARCTFDLPYGIVLGGGLSSLRLTEPDPAQPSGYRRSSRMLCAGVDVRASADVSDAVELRGSAEYVSGPDWTAADVLEGEEAPGFDGFHVSCGALVGVERVPGVEFLEANLGFDSVNPGSGEDRERTLSPVIGVWFSESARLRFSACIHSFAGTTGGDGYTDYIAEAAVRI
jgi:hypothetical protein